MPALEETFQRVFGRPPQLQARAPGRVNLIGEHTDYSEGLVLPAAVARHVAIAADANGTGVIRIYSAVYESLAAFPAAAPGEPALPAWARYPQGIAVALTARGARLPGLDVAVGGDLPIGAGLSSSAALEVASALVFERWAGLTLSPRARARLCHEAEVRFVGVPCGIMDQFASSLSRAGHVLFLDCRSEDTHHIPWPPDLTIAVCNTGIRRTVGTSGYGVRRSECAAALDWLRSRGSSAGALRDLGVEDLSQIDAMPEPLRRRVRHVVTENARVVAVARVLEGGAPEDLRAIFLASHQSLRDDFEVSCPELDAMVDAALGAPGCLAARMTGAGFGGCVVALVSRAEAARFLAGAAERYAASGYGSGSYFTSDPAEGARARSGPGLSDP